jgi:hypothetical protein
MLALPRLGHIHLLPGVGHMGMIEAPKMLEDAVYKWLQHIQLLCD